MTLALIVLLPLLSFFLPLLTDTKGRSLCALATMVAPVLGAMLLWSHAATAFSGGVVAQSWPWIERLGLAISFRLDGVSFLFALLILGIGILVIIYARSNLSKNDPMGRFFFFLLLFMAAMLG